MLKITDSRCIGLAADWAISKMRFDASIAQSAKMTLTDLHHINQHHAMESRLCEALGDLFCSEPVPRHPAEVKCDLARGQLQGSFRFQELSLLRFIVAADTVAQLWSLLTVSTGKQKWHETWPVMRFHCC